MNRSRVIIASLLGLVIIVWVAMKLLSPDETTASAPEGWTTLTAATAKAKLEKKKILVDVYTDWCGWCKRMDADVYSKPDVLALLDKHFVRVKLNAESDAPVTFGGATMSSSEFAREAGVNGYPTTLFYDESGRPIQALPGYYPADKFAKILTFIGEGHYITTTFEDFLARSL